MKTPQALRLLTLAALSVPMLAVWKAPAQKLGLEAYAAATRAPNILASWSFDDPTLATRDGTEPSENDHVQLVPSWSGQALLADGSAQSILSYPVVAKAGRHLLNPGRGAVVFWFKPAWSSASLEGKGPGEFACLFEVASTENKESDPSWALCAAPDGDTLYVVTLAKGRTETLLKAPIAWQAEQWYLITMNYTPTNTALFVNTAEAGRGGGLTLLPDSTFNLYVGSDASGKNPAHGTLEELRTCDGSVPRANVGLVYLSERFAVDAARWAASLEKTRALVAEQRAAKSGGGIYTLMGEGGASCQTAAFSYSNGLWLDIQVCASNVVLTLHGTGPDTNYLFYGRSDPAAGLWQLEAGALGDTNNNWVAVTLPLAASTNRFFVAGVGDDTDGDGLSDIYESLVTHTDPLSPDTGNTGVPDGYKDADGDGWTTIEESQRGTDSLQWDEPPPPPDFQARLDATGTNVALTWSPGSGAPQGYVLKKSGTEIARPSSNAVSAVDSPAANYSSVQYAPVYQLRAVYSGGRLSAPALATVPGSGPAIDARIVPGTTNHFLVLSAPPPGLAAVRMFWYVWNSQTSEAEYPFVDVPIAEFTNGIATLPPGVLQPYLSKEMFVLGLGEDGQVGPYFGVGVVEHTHAPLRDFDWGPTLRDNLVFLLRAATVSEQFRLVSSSPPATGHEPPSADYECSSCFRYYSWSDRLVFERESVFQNNRTWKNLLFDTNEFNANGDFLTGANYDHPWSVRIVENPKYAWTPPPGNPNPGGSVLGAEAAQWIYARWPNPPCDTSDLSELGVDLTGDSRVVLDASARNYYGLPFTGAQIVTTTNAPRFYELTGSDPGTLPCGMGNTYFLDAQTPQFETLGYYFVPLPGLVSYSYEIAPVPGMPDFSVTNETPFISAAAGTPLFVAGWAKQRIVNGYTNQFTYLGQYFDKACKVDPATGLTTTNETGILSPYGEFLPTEPGPTGLITFPDLDTGQQGTCTVHVIKLQLDVDHNGEMDLSFTGPDNTGAQRPFHFWVNNDFDRLNWVDGNDLEQDDLERIGNSVYYDQRYSDKDYAFRGYQGQPAIPCTRDLEDYTRLWLPGLSNLVAALPANYSVRLTLYGDAEIRLFRAWETNGGTNYLFDETVASNQVAQSGALYLGLLTSSSEIFFTAQANLGEHFIWCGAKRGNATLYLDVLDGDQNFVTTAEASLQIQDIKEMYERWTVNEPPTAAPTNLAYLAVEDLPAGVSKFQYPHNGSTDTNTPYILFVHGWNMERWEKDRFAETAFKRLYWQGYQGRFGIFRWPTDNRFDGLWDAITDRRNYDRSEFNAWQSAVGLRNFLTGLKSTYGNNVYLLAHSMGNVVAGEALRLATNQLVNTYVASQAAVPAHTYDPTITNYSFSYLTANFGPRTPNIYVNWFSSSIGAGQRVNFYNTNDYALLRPRWELNQLLKPDLATSLGWSYVFDGSPYDGIQSYTPGAPDDTPPWNHFFKFNLISTVTFDIVNAINHRYEVIAYAAQSRTTALGRTANVGNLNRNVDLARSANPIWPPDPSGHDYGDHKWHSGQYRSTNMRQKGYWQALLSEEGFNINP